MYVKGVRPDLDQEVERIRRLQITQKFCKLCPSCRRVLKVEMFPAYQATVCRECEALGTNPSRFVFVSYLP